MSERRVYFTATTSLSIPAESTDNFMTLLGLTTTGFPILEEVHFTQSAINLDGVPVCEINFCRGLLPPLGGYVVNGYPIYPSDLVEDDHCYASSTSQSIADRWGFEYWDMRTPYRHIVLPPRRVVGVGSTASIALILSNLSTSSVTIAGTLIYSKFVK